MWCSLLLELHNLLDDEEFQRIENYIMHLTINDKFTLYSFYSETGIATKKLAQVLQILCEKNILKRILAIRCPKCGLLLKEIEDYTELSNEVFCYGCEEIQQLSTDDVEIIYSLKKPLFIEGHRNGNYAQKLVWSDVPKKEDVLTYLVENEILDFNKMFYSPSEVQYIKLKELYNDIFMEQDTTTEKGDTLEGLTKFLFNICKQFKADSVRLHPNQIDCYVRNKLCIPGIASGQAFDGFLIECKNEGTKPKGGYMNKLHSILRTTGKKYGIIVSKYNAPHTFKSLANKVFLKDEIIIISMDKNDLKRIIFDKDNLLECLERKIDEVKLDATRDLREIDLYYA